MATPESEKPYVPDDVWFEKEEMGCFGDGILEDGSKCPGCEECQGVPSH